VGRLWRPGRGRF